MKIPHLSKSLPQKDVEELRRLIQKKQEVRSISDQIETERKKVVSLLQQLKMSYQNETFQEKKDQLAQKGIGIYLAFEAHMQTLQNKIRSL